MAKPIVAIVGRPNAGKSSLLNALVGFDRAIVTNIPGTTRDTVEERAELGGVTLRLIDTAGLRDSDDPIEQLGVERSRAAMDEAALVLLVVDGTEKPTQEDADLARTIAEAGKPFILVRSKRDLAGEHADELEALSQGAPTVSLSARTGEGLEELGQAVAALFPQGSEDKAGELITTARQAEAAGRALNCVVRANQALSDGVTPDALLTDVEEALEAVRHGADCLGVGAAFSTHTKEDVDVLPEGMMKAICDAVDIPVVAIGGIHKENLLRLKGTGVNGVALVSAIFGAEDIEAECRELKALAEQIVK